MLSGLVKCTLKEFFKAARKMELFSALTNEEVVDYL
jgi:hypothetical protein